MKIPLINLPFWLFVRAYQLTLSHIIGRSCRHHPTCSHYALWNLEKLDLITALIRSSVRVATCNPLFKGGFDYPFVAKLPSDPIRSSKQLKIVWWYVPHGKKYLLIKALK